MSNLIPFDFQGAAVRVVDIDGVAWFVAKDVASVLAYTNPQKAVRDHCKTARPLGVNDSFTLDKQTVIIEERDIYRLVIRSKLPAAEQFEDWIVGTVLPSIRKHGFYHSGQTLPAHSALPDFTDPAEAAIAWAKEFKEKRALQIERDEAVRTKALIGSSREATSMAKASAESRRAKALERELGISRDWKRVMAVDWLPQVFDLPNRVAYAQIGKKLSSISREMNLEPRQVEDMEFGHVKAYHVDVITEFQKRVCMDSDLLAKYRKRQEAA